MEVVPLAVVDQLVLLVVVVGDQVEVVEVFLLLVAEVGLDQVVVREAFAHLPGLELEVQLLELVVVLVAQEPYQLEIFDLALLVVA